MWLERTGLSKFLLLYCRALAWSLIFWSIQSYSVHFCSEFYQNLLQNLEHLINLRDFFRFLEGYRRLRHHQLIKGRGSSRHQIYSPWRWEGDFSFHLHNWSRVLLFHAFRFTVVLLMMQVLLNRDHEREANLWATNFTNWSEGCTKKY